MKELTRTKVNTFNIENSITIEELKNNPEKIEIITIEKFFEEKQAINLNDRKKDLFLNGVRLTFEKPNDIYKIYNNNQFIGLGIIENNLLKRDVIL